LRAARQTASTILEQGLGWREDDVEFWLSHGQDGAPHFEDDASWVGDGYPALVIAWLLVERLPKAQTGRLLAVLRAVAIGTSEEQLAARQAQVVREVFGNPFRARGVSVNWLTPTVLALANQMYDARDFSLMPILADALQDADCDNEDILNHCRDTNLQHVRGCWLVDELLLKT
jgi:hypothetical protein